MRRYSNYTMCFLAFLLLIIGAGCSDPDKAGNSGTTPPTVISEAPPDGWAGVCPNTIITATFSKAMNPATINDTTFLGNAEPTEKRKNLAAERGVNSKGLSDGWRIQTGNRSQPYRSAHREQWHEDGGILDRTSGRYLLRRRHTTGG